MPEKGDKLVEVYRAQGEAAAQVIKSKLESAGIPSMIKSTVSPSVYAFVVDGLGEYRVFVDSSCAEEARELLKPD